MRKFDISDIISKINSFACLVIFIGVFFPFFTGERKSQEVSVFDLIYEFVNRILKGKLELPNAIWFLLCIVALVAAFVAGNLFKQSLSMKFPIIMIVSGGYVKYLINQYIGMGEAKLASERYALELLDSFLGVGYDFITFGFTVVIICGIAGICVNYYLNNIKYNKDIQLPSFVNNFLKNSTASSQNNSSNNYCPNCGANYSDGQTFCSSCGQALPTKVICPNCNAVNQEDSVFCSGCGTRLKD